MSDSKELDNTQYNSSRMIDLWDDSGYSADVEEESEVEEPAVLDDYLILDEITSESEEVTEATEPSIPQVFDSHFHLDRSSLAV